MVEIELEETDLGRLGDLIMASSRSSRSRFWARKVSLFAISSSATPFLSLG